MTVPMQYFSWLAAGRCPDLQEEQLAPFVHWCEAGHVLARLERDKQVTDHDVFGFKYQFSSSMAAHEAAVLAFEIRETGRIFKDVDFPVVLLKGGAYLALGLSAARGRRVSDLDIMVPRQHLMQTERLLLENSWGRDKKTDNAYDQAYYRNWMHELPPLRHSERRTIIDVHHALMPPVSPLSHTGAAMFDALQPVTDSGLFALGTQDMFLHSCLHSFYASDFQTPLRSLMELYDLAGEMDAAAWNGLCARAKSLGLVWPLVLGLDVLARYFPDRCPVHVLDDVRRRAGRRLARHFLARMVDISLRGTEGIAFRTVGKFWLVRSHFTAMKPRYLLRHYWQKHIRGLGRQ